jgi:hypothetical protein
MSQTLRRCLRLPPQTLKLLFFSVSLLIGWFLVLFSLQTTRDLKGLLVSGERWLQEDLAIVYREVSLSDSLGRQRAFLSAEEIEAIRDVPGVQAADPILRNHYPALLRVGGGPFPALESDVFIEALPEDYLAKVPEGWSWSPDAETVPILVPRLFLNLYNFGFAPGKGLPQIAPDMARRVPLRLVMTHATGQVDLSARVIGFSDQITSLHVPAAFLEWTNREYASTVDPKQTRPTRIAVKVGTTGAMSALQAMLTRRGLDLDESSRRAAQLENLLRRGIFALTAIGAVVALLALLLSFGQIEQRLSDQAEAIRRLFFLGFSLGAVAWHLGGRLFAAFTLCGSTVLVALYAVRLFLLRLLPEGGFQPEAMLSPEVLATALFLYASALLWGGLRLRRRLRSYIC